MSRRPGPLVELTRARILEFVREPEAVFWVFVFPVLLALALGIAFRAKPVEKARVAVVSDSPAVEALAGQIRSAPDIDLESLDSKAAVESLRKGKVDIVIEIRSGGEVTYRYDPTRSESRTARLSVDNAVQRARGRADPLPVREEHVVQPGSRYIDFLIPGLVGLNLMGSGMWGIGFSVVVSRTRKLLKRFAATPMRRSDYLLSFGLSRLVFLVVEVAAVIAFGWAVFGVRVRGSMIDLAVVTLVGSGTFAGLGLLVAARARTIEAVSGWMNLVQLPMWLVSGTFFSYERFPAAVHGAIRALPLTALNDALRAVVNDGAPLAASWVEMLILLAWGTISFAIAVRIFRWQ
ncbi:MAG: ABC transporter permease [Acidobacteriota bacterium]